jgi:hypothetical protein
MEALPTKLQDLENQLRVLVPQTPQTSREQLLYRAGWEAALAQHAMFTETSPAVAMQNTRQPYANYLAVACAALLLLSTALGWQVWQSPQSSVAPPVVSTTTSTPSEKPLSAAPATLVNTEQPFDIVERPFQESATSTLARYLELRERVTRGGLSMWPVSTPARIEPGAAAQLPARDWQAELLRETL